MVFSIGSEFVENKNSTKFVIKKIKACKKDKKYNTLCLWF